MLREAHRLELRVITELVINHTSDQHPWFQAARAAPAGSPERDFYVWSDTDQKYLDTRIIFTDTESSNWSWDNQAKAYYWHRFFSHQPDLNFDNPQVLEAVSATVHQPIQEIVLNAVELQLHSAVATGSDGKLQQATIALDVDLERDAELRRHHAAGPGDHDREHGHHQRSAPKASTAAHSRTATAPSGSSPPPSSSRPMPAGAFPCWDEPEHKATFQVRLLVPEGLLGLSNTAVVEERQADGGTWVTFDKTMKMSTNLAALFVVGPLVATGARDVDGVPLRVAASPGGMRRAHRPAGPVPRV